MYDVLTTNRAASVFHEVRRTNGKVNSETARSFIHILAYAGFPEEALHKLPLRMKLNLAEAIANGHDEPRAAMLDALYSAMGLHEIIAHRSTRLAERFLSPENLDRMSARWRGGNLEDDIAAMINSPFEYSIRDKLRMLQFISDQYNDHLGLPHTKVKLFHGDPNKAGYYSPGKKAIFINVNAGEFQSDFAAALGTVVHENTHYCQDRLSSPLNFFNSKEDKLLGKLYAINGRGYIEAREGGVMAYRYQPIEHGAFAAGDTAERLFTKIARRHMSWNDNLAARLGMGRHGRRDRFALTAA